VWIWVITGYIRCSGFLAGWMGGAWHADECAD